MIERIQKQFGGYVITNNEEIIKYSTFYHRPKRYRWTIETLYSSTGLWGGQTIVLLGDVYYTDNVAEKINEFKGAIMFFGNEDEIFAISFGDYDKIVNTLEWVIEEHYTIGELKENGRLWQLYYKLYDIDYRYHKITEDFTYIKDETRDFDEIGDYIKLNVCGENIK